jgi:hypothetical protein
LFPSLILPDHTILSVVCQAKLDQLPAPEQIYVDVMVIALTILVLLARDVLNL